MFCYMNQILDTFFVKGTKLWTHFLLQEPNWGTNLCYIICEPASLKSGLLIAFRIRHMPVNRKDNRSPCMATRSALLPVFQHRKWGPEYWPLFVYDTFGINSESLFISCVKCQITTVFYFYLQNMSDSRNVNTSFYIPVLLPLCELL